MSTKIITVLKDDRFEEIFDIFKKTSAQEVIFVLPRKSRFLSNEEHFSLLSDEAESNNKSILILSSNSQINETALKYDFGVLSSEENSSKPVTATAVSSSTADSVTSIDQKYQPSDKESKDNITEHESDLTEDQEENTFEQEEQNNNVADEENNNDEGENNLGATKTAADGWDSSNEWEVLPTLAKTPQKTKPITNSINAADQDSIKIKISKKIEERPIKISQKQSEISAIGPGKVNEKDRQIIDQIQSVWQSQAKREKIFSKNNNEQKKFSATKFSGIRTPRFPSGPWMFLGSLGVIVAGILIYIYAGSAKITIKPRSHDLDLNLQISVSDSYPSVDAETRKIPGQFFSIKKEIRDEFSATGERDVVQKAKGKITIYNENSSIPQILIATTRFEFTKENPSEGSRIIFRTLKTVTVPGTKVQNGEILPGMIDAEVIADKAGDSYNISAGKFTIPAFKEKSDLQRYEKFYGISKEPMKGGIIGKAKVVTEKDYTEAKEKIENRLTEETKQQLKDQSSGLTIFNSIDPVLTGTKVSAQIDEAIDKFEVSSEAEIKNIGFKKEDLHQLIIDYIQKNEELVVFPEKFELNFDNVKFDESQKTLNFKVAVKSVVYGKIDEEKIITDLFGKKEEQIKEYIKGLNNISSAKVILSPFWVTKVPTNKNKINIKIEYD